MKHLLYLIAAAVLLASCASPSSQKFIGNSQSESSKISAAKENAIAPSSQNKPEAAARFYTSGEQLAADCFADRRSNSFGSKKLDKAYWLVSSPGVKRIYLTDCPVGGSYKNNYVAYLEQKGANSDIDFYIKEVSTTKNKNAYNDGKNLYLSGVNFGEVELRPGTGKVEIAFGRLPTITPYSSIIDSYRKVGTNRLVIGNRNNNPLDLLWILLQEWAKTDGYANQIYSQIQASTSRDKDPQAKELRAMIGLAGIDFEQRIALSGDRARDESTRGQARSELPDEKLFRMSGSGIRVKRGNYNAYYEIKNATYFNVENMLHGTKSVPLSVRSVGESECVLTRLRAHSKPGSVIIEYDNSKCKSFRVGYAHYLLTKKGKFSMVGVAGALPSPADGLGSNVELIPSGGNNLLIGYKTGKYEFSDSELENSGIHSDLCISYYCLKDAVAERSILEEKTQAAASDARSALGGGKGEIDHPLLTMNPQRPNAGYVTEGGALQDSDWYILGLQKLYKSDSSVKRTMLSYLKARRVFTYSKVDSGNQAEINKFNSDLEAELRQFVDRMFAVNAAALPASIISFSKASLGQYDNSTQTLKIHPCTSGCSIPGDRLADFMKDLAGEGDMSVTGKIQPVLFAQFRMTGDNNGAPYYILNRGLGESINIRVSSKVSDSLLSLAKELSVSDKGHNGKELYAKILYGQPVPKSFGTSTNVQKMMFGTLTGGAAVTYISKPKAICIFEGIGAKAVLCQNL